MRLPDHDPQHKWEWQAHLDQFRALFEQGSEALALLSQDGIILFASQGLERMLGYTTRDFIGQNAFEYMHPDDHEEAYQSLTRVLTYPERPVFIRCRLRHRRGSWRWLEGIGSNHLQDDKYRALIINFRDVTAEFEAQDTLQRRIAFDQALLQYSQKLELSQDYTGLINATQEIVVTTMGYQSVWVYLALNEEEMELLTSAGEVAQFLEPEFKILSLKEDKL